MPKTKTGANKQELIKLIQRYGELNGQLITRDSIDTVLNALKDLAEDALAQGQSFTIPHMVKLVRVQTKARAARKGTNPRTGEAIDIPARPAKTVVKARTLTAAKKAI
jgi:DNA-binding protein HU-beta